jgi:glycerol-3-phosphate dehydrogenase
VSPLRGYRAILKITVGLRPRLRAIAADAASAGPLPMTSNSPYDRNIQWERLDSAGPFDIAIIGGGATGNGVAIDAAARGYRVALCEQHDFGKGTSSRSTKLVHGGVRYLKQGHVGLVRGALRERGLLRQNAPHLVHPLPNIVPLYQWWEGPYFALGLTTYDWLAGKLSLGRSQWLDAAETLDRVPTLEPRGLRGGVLYWDAQFDDARLLVNMMQTAVDHGAICVNYAPVRELIKESGRIRGFVAENLETGRSARVDARVVVNATGPFSDSIARLDDPQAPPTLATSQGIHLVFDRKFLPGGTALMVPRTRDGRVVFAIPWHGQTMVGTTDTPIANAPLEPEPQQAEIDFLLETVAPYLTPAPQAADIRSIFTGVRPLVRQANVSQTSKLGRDHVIRVSPSGLVSILGGKWTSYRHMAQDGVDQAAKIGGLRPAECQTHRLPLHGANTEQDTPVGDFADYGNDAKSLAELLADWPEWNKPLVTGFPDREVQVVWAARREMARTAEDVLARRLRLLFLDVSAAREAAPRVVELLAAELGRSAEWQRQQCQDFDAVAERYAPKDRHV